MAYRIEIGSRAEAQFEELDSTIASAIERKITWLAENAAVMIHRRLVGMPEDLAGLCKLRVGDWRILYWIYPIRSDRTNLPNSASLRGISGSLIIPSAKMGALRQMMPGPQFPSAVGVIVAALYERRKSCNFCGS